MSKRDQKQEQKPARASSDAVERQSHELTVNKFETREKANAMTSMPTHSVKIAELIVSRHNVRYGVEPSAERVKELADNIASIGRLIHPMVVLVEAGKAGVVAGKTRLRALQLLVAEGRLPADAAVLVSITDSAEQARLVSLSENVARQNMHPADECISFRDLIGDGKSVESVAVAFGVTVRYIEGRLRIANLAPALMQGFREYNVPNLDQVMALCLTDDHDKQSAVWEAAKGGWDGYRRPAALREAIAGDKAIDALRDRRTKLVTLDEYESAGGLVSRSLFGDQAYINDPDLFSKLVAEKLDSIAAAVRAEGWFWVDVVPDRLEEASRKFGVSQPKKREHSSEESIELAELKAEADRLRDVYEGAPQNSDAEADAEQRIADIEVRLEQLYAKRNSYTSRQLSKSGALVGLDYSGNLKVFRGLVRREDRAGLEACGGRETGDAGRPKADTLSQALRDDLHGLRILAVQAEVAKNARAAKIVMALWAVNQIGGGLPDSGLPTDLSIAGSYNLRGRLHSLNVEAERAARDSVFAEAVTNLPESDEERFDLLAAMSDQQLDNIIAKAVALTVMPSAVHEGLTAKLLDFLQFDMADHFAATPDHYTARASKKLVVQALAEAGKAPDAETLGTLKKGALATVAAERLVGTRWVPELIRTPSRTLAAPRVADGSVKAGKTKSAPRADKRVQKTSGGGVA